MKMLKIIANWKANKNISEAKFWLEQILKDKEYINNQNNKEIIICPPAFLLTELYSFAKFNGLNISIGLQDISQYENGAYTGEISAELIKDLAKYVIIGHSERRKYFHEIDDIIARKILKAKNSQLEVIYCVQDENTKVFDGIGIIAYEPVFAIGTGNPDTPENANEIAGKILNKHKVNQVIYGGSVTGENVNKFTKIQNISGVLIGSASLNPQEFIKIFKNA